MMTRSIELPPISIGNIQVTLEGNAILCVHNFDEKTLQQLADAHGGKATEKKQPKDPIDCFLRSLHVFPGTKPIVHDEDPDNVYAVGEFGFPCSGLKAQIVRAATDAGLKMTDMRRAIRVPGELLRIDAEKAVMRRDMCRVSNGAPDVRYRGAFYPWSITHTIQYNRAVLTVEKLLNLIRIAGFGVGFGESRPERGGDWGTYLLASAEELPDEVYGK
jgi:hypothetical protein